MAYRRRNTSKDCPPEQCQPGKNCNGSRPRTVYEHHGWATEQASMRATFLEALFGAIVQESRARKQDVFENVANVARKLGI